MKSLGKFESDIPGRTVTKQSERSLVPPQVMTRLNDVMKTREDYDEDIQARRGGCREWRGGPVTTRTPYRLVAKTSKTGILSPRSPRP